MHNRPKTGIILLMGVAGSGKSSTGAKLSALTGWTFRDADTFHPKSNVDKMSQGVPLTDADRWPWLDAIAAWIDERTRSGETGIVTCSALKRIYRDRLLRDRPHVKLVFLSGSKDLIGARMRQRENHFMPAALLDSQFATLEAPAVDEHALTMDVGPPVTAIAESIVKQLGLTPRSP
jgi:carbohydrate kinase (thermoresistant glucokinase family)